jgi:hypothetical protein
LNPGFVFDIGLVWQSLVGMNGHFDSHWFRLAAGVALSLG